MISEFEKKRRAKNFAYAKASITLEGGRVSEELERQIQKHIQGEIEMSDLRQYMNSRECWSIYRQGNFLERKEKVGSGNSVPNA